MFQRATRMHRVVVLIAALLPFTAIATTGPEWWDSLSVDPEEYSDDWIQDGKLYEYKRPGSFSRLAGRLAEDLAHVKLENLFARCEAVIAAGLAAEKEREQRTDGSLRHVPQSWFGGPRVRDWLLCAATMRRMGESEDQRWAPVLERLYEEWEAAAGGQSQTVNILVEGRPREDSVRMVLRWEAKEAYQRLVLRDFDLAQLAVDLQHAFAEEFRSWSTLQIRARSIQRFRLTSDGPWPEEYRALWTHPDPDIRLSMLRSTPVQFIPPEEHLFYVSLLTDPKPDPRVQEFLWGVLTASAHIGAPFIPALLEFLKREDLDDRVRRIAEHGIRARGYALRRTAEGVVLEPDENERVRAHLEWLTDSDPTLQGRAYARLRDCTSFRPTDWIPTTLEFLAREEIGDTTRDLATKLLSDRGYVPATADDGTLMAVPADGGPPIRQRTPRSE